MCIILIGEKKLKNKSITTIMAIVLISSIALSLADFPTINAQATKKTYAFIGATPNPIGINQEVLIHVGITDPLTVNFGWEGLTVTVKRPDGQTETLGPFTTDATGGTGTVYVPTMAGNYTLQTHFPAQASKFLHAESQLELSMQPAKVQFSHLL